MSGSAVIDPSSPGQMAPDIVTVGPEGAPLHLSSLRGHAVIVSFLSDEWDPARRHQIALYNQALSQVTGAGRVLSVAEAGGWIEAKVSEDDSKSRPQCTDEVRIAHLKISSTDPAAESFGVRGKQAVFVIDPEGTIRWQFIGGTSSLPAADDLIGAIEQLQQPKGLSRRQFLATSVAAVIALSIIPRLAPAAPRPAQTTPQSPDSTQAVTLNINGKDVRVAVDARVTVLDALRERIGLTGTKKGCDHGQCGACTVLIDGRRVNSCLILAMQAEGSKIETIEGLSSGEKLHPVQEAFIKHDGFQCGYCTPGQIMSAVACIREGHAHSDEEISEWMSGNICRCGAYMGIRAAIKESRGQVEEMR